MAGEKSCLEVGQEANGCFLIKKGMGDFILFALLPRGEDFFAGVVFKQHGSVFFEIEIFAGDLLAIEEGERGAISKEGAEFFHQVERERGAPRTITM